jgi:hypothetical protein
MSILEIELTPEIEQQLREKASHRGLSAPDYARSLVVGGLAQEAPEPLKRSIMELEGLGAEIWKDEHGNLIDAQEYVNDLRREWDHRL